MPVRLSVYDGSISASKKFTTTVQVIYEPMLAADPKEKGKGYLGPEVYDVSLVFKDAEFGYKGVASPGAPQTYPPGAGEANYQITWRGVTIGSSSQTLQAELECRMGKASSERWGTLTAFATLPTNANAKPRIETSVERAAYIHICAWK